MVTVAMPEPPRRLVVLARHRCSGDEQENSRQYRNGLAARLQREMISLRLRHSMPTLERESELETFFLTWKHRTEVIHLHRAPLHARYKVICWVI